ncbi:unnamed protein product [Rhizoctonia solani]|uniref:Zn(2)-C6 fungal-type domain-containing protein n=1 Tax=Rhizoctonia solani TaxID=456999 RepID=A0A8H3BM91_9AGAM|nr:unnamed protein product [Rhizoctonia solani]
MREAVWGTQLADSTLPSLAFPPSDVDLKWPLPVASAIPTKPSIKSPSGHMSASQAPDNGVSLGHDFSMTPGPKLQLTHSPQRPFTTLPQVCDVDYQGSSTHSPPPPSGKSPRSSNPVSTQAMCHADVELSQLNHRSRGLMNSLSLTHTHTPHPHAGSHAYISKVGGIPGVAGAHLFLGSPTPTKRQRTSQTCEKCRERKAKCNGARPTCQRCAARAQIYEYAKERQTKKPDKTPPPRYSVSDVVSLSTPIIPNRFKYVWPTADCSSAQNDGSLTLPSPPIVSPTQHCLVATSHLVLTPPKPTQKQAEGNGTTATTKSSTDPQISFSENGGCSQRTTGAVPMLGRRNTSPPLALGFKPVNSSPLVFYSPTPICQLPTIDMILIIAGTIEAGRQRTPVGRKNSVPTRGKAHGMVLSPGSSHKFSRQPFHVQLLGFIDNIMEGLTVSSLLGRVMQAHISVTSIFILPDIYELKMFQPSEVPIHFVGDLRASDPDRSEVIHLKEDTNPNSGPHRILGDLSSLCLLVSDKQPNMPVTKGSCIQHPRLGYERSEADTILPKPFGESGSTKTATTPPSATPGTEHQNNSNDPPQAFEVTAVKLLAFLLASHDTLKQLSGPIKGS